MIDVAQNYLRAGLCVLPAHLAEKRPAVTSWKQFQARLPTDAEIGAWFQDKRPLCVVAGAVSGNLELLDFDVGGELFAAWLELVRSEAPDLVGRLVIERSQSGGRHVVYRCERPVSGNRQLAQRTVVLPTDEPVEIAGKRYVPRRVGDRYEITLTLIETRGEGGLLLCAPTPGYVIEQGALTDLPILTEAERSLLIEAAYALNETLPPVTCNPARLHAAGRPGDDFNQRGDIRPTLRRQGWSMARGGDDEYWRRPGKDLGWSATLRGRVFYVFSTNAAPFEPNRAYSPFAVYTLLEHGGDFAAAAAALRLQGYGQQAADGGVDLAELLTAAPANSPVVEFDDPGPLPLELLRIPGFVAAVMDHCLATAPYPNAALAFCGAVALQAVLAGRKVRDQADNRTNLYLLALGYSAVGKDWPRKVNTHILHRVGLIEALGDKFASGEGIQDALFLTPSMLFQTDEIDGLLQAINKSRDARYENIMGTLLTLYSAANTVFPMRRKAGKEAPGVIDQPCLVVFGTAIPTHYYDALSQRMLTNGFFARMLIVESGARSPGQEPGLIAPPPGVLEIAQWWADFKPGGGNLDQWHPDPSIVPADDGALALLADARASSEAEYAAAERRGDPVGTTVWGRFPEQVRKLALLYAISACHDQPRIDAAAVAWATELVCHQTRRMLFMAQQHVADNPFHAECLKLLRKLREAPGRQLPHSVLLKRMKMDANAFAALIDTLCQQGMIEVVSTPRSGWPTRAYRMIHGESCSGGES